MSEATRKIDEYIASIPDWRRNNLIAFRALVHEAIPGVVEEWKWMVPVFLVNGRLVCAMSVFKDHTKFNFFEGASIEDKTNIFNNGLESKKQRSIDMSEHDVFNEAGIRQIIIAAAENTRS